MTGYTYDAADFPDGKVRVHKLAAAVQAAGLASAAFLYVSAEGDGLGGGVFEGDCTIIFDDDLSPADELALDALVAAHHPAAELAARYYETARDQGVAGKLLRETWWATDQGGGVYAGKARETTYSYQGQKLLARTERSYYSDGTVQSERTVGYYVNASGNVVEKEA